MHGSGKDNGASRLEIYQKVILPLDIPAIASFPFPEHVGIDGIC